MRNPKTSFANHFVYSEESDDECHEYETTCYVIISVNGTNDVFEILTYQLD